MHSQSDMIENIRKTKKVWIDVTNQTKTTLNVALYNGETRFQCSYIPNGCDNLKFHTQTGYNMWYNTSYEANYFKMLKTQKWPEFKFYLEKLLESLHLSVDGTLTVYVELPPDIQAKLEAPAYAA